MGRSSSKKPASDRVSPGAGPETPSHNDSSLSSSPGQNIAQAVRQTIQSEKDPRNIRASDWTSAMGLNQSDIYRASLPSFSAPQPKKNNTAQQGLNQSDIHRASLPSISAPQPKKHHTAQQRLQSKAHNHTAPTNIMTSFHGVKMYSHGTSAEPIISSDRSATDPQNIPSKTRTSSTYKILLPRPEQTQRHNTSPYYRPSSSPHTAPTALLHQQQQQQPPADHPFDPRECHWRALRDVAFVLDGGMALSSDDLCALLRFRYAQTDLLMAHVEPSHVRDMYNFCKRLEGQMYEARARKLIRAQMEGDLERMRGGGVGGVSGDF